MPSFVFELLEERVGRGHVGLPELAVLAATVEDVVHSEAVDVLNEVYARLGFSTSEPLPSAAKADFVMQAFLFLFLLPGYRGDDNRPMHTLLRDGDAAYPGWSMVYMWARDIMETIKFREQAVHNPFTSREDYFRDYTSMVHLVEHILDGMGDIQNLECNEMKDKLMGLEDPGRNDGRVRLTRFYNDYIETGSGHFSESPGYLRYLGALDEETDPKQPSVVVPNIIYGDSNCVGTIGLNSLCCIDHCLRLMEVLERRIAHPAAEPQRIAQLLAQLPSATVPAPRNLSASLLRKLDLIAAQHGGLVPLHSRLFEQLMHHAYPNECSRPRPSEWRVEAETDWTVWELHTHRVQPKVLEELQAQAAAAEEAEALFGQKEDQGDDTCMLWTEEEELLAEHRAPEGVVDRTAHRRRLDEELGRVPERGDGVLCAPEGGSPPSGRGIRWC